jgi:hypothetical protein
MVKITTDNLFLSIQIPLVIVNFQLIISFGSFLYVLRDDPSSLCISYISRDDKDIFNIYRICFSLPIILLA